MFTNCSIDGCPPRWAFSAGVDYFEAKSLYMHFFTKLQIYEVVFTPLPNHMKLVIKNATFSRFKNTIPFKNHRTI